LDAKHFGAKRRKTLARKPPLTSVDPTSTGISPPRKLGKHGLSLWNAIMAEYEIEDRGGIEVLTQICQTADRVEELAKQISADGPVIRVRGIPRAHPALKDELQSRAFIVKSLERLGINLEAVQRPGRPPGTWSTADAD
jgi:hypothetical protein